MHFGKFDKRNAKQNYRRGKKSENRDAILARSRQQRQQRENQRKRQESALLLQSWLRMRHARNETLTKCRNEFNRELEASLASITQKSKAKTQISMEEFIGLLKLFRHSLFGFERTNLFGGARRGERLLPRRFGAGGSEQQWLNTSVKRLSSLLLHASKNNELSKHFIGYLMDSRGKSASDTANEANIDGKNVREWQREIVFFICVLMEYLENIEVASKSSEIDAVVLKVEHSIVTIIWTVVDCSKWKYFASDQKVVSAKAQNLIKLVCFQILKQIFDETNLLTIWRRMFIKYMPIPRSDAFASNGSIKAILALSHTILIRFFQFRRIALNNANLVETLESFLVPSPSASPAPPQASGPVAKGAKQDKMEMSDVDDETDESMGGDSEVKTGQSEQDADTPMESKEAKVSENTENKENDIKKDKNEGRVGARIFEGNVVALICNEILSIPYYCERLSLYSLDQSILKSLAMGYIWKQVIFEYNAYVTRIHQSNLYFRPQIEEFYNSKQASRGGTSSAARRGGARRMRGHNSNSNDGMDSLWSEVTPSYVLPQQMMQNARKPLQKLESAQNGMNPNNGNKANLSSNKAVVATTPDLDEIPDFGYDSGDSDESSGDDAAAGLGADESKQDNLQEFVRATEDRQFERFQAERMQSRANDVNMDASGSGANGGISGISGISGASGAPGVGANEDGNNMNFGMEEAPRQLHSQRSRRARVGKTSKKEKKYRRRRRRRGGKANNDVVCEFARCVWFVMNVMEIYKKFVSDAWKRADARVMGSKDEKEVFVALVDIGNKVFFKLFKFVKDGCDADVAAAFMVPYANLNVLYEDRYLQLFDTWRSETLISLLVQLLMKSSSSPATDANNNNNNNSSTSNSSSSSLLSAGDEWLLDFGELSVACEFLTNLKQLVPPKKEHVLLRQIYLPVLASHARKDRNASVTNKSDSNIIVAVYENFLLKYNMWTVRDWQNVLYNFVSNYRSLGSHVSGLISKQNVVVNSLSSLSSPSRAGTSFSEFGDAAATASAQANVRAGTETEIDRIHLKRRDQEISRFNQNVMNLEFCKQCMGVFEWFLQGYNFQLRVVDDTQFFKYQVPFPHEKILQLIEALKYVLYVAYWRDYGILVRFHKYFGMDANAAQLGQDVVARRVGMLEGYSDVFESFLGCVVNVFASLRDRHSRKPSIVPFLEASLKAGRKEKQKRDEKGMNKSKSNANDANEDVSMGGVKNKEEEEFEMEIEAIGVIRKFQNDDIWLMSKYIDLKRFEFELLNKTEEEEEKDDDDNDMNANNNANVANMDGLDGLDGMGGMGGMAGPGGNEAFPMFGDNVEDESEEIGRPLGPFGDPFGGMMDVLDDMGMGGFGAPFGGFGGRRRRRPSQRERREEWQRMQQRMQQQRVQSDKLEHLTSGLTGDNGGLNGGGNGMNEDEDVNMNGNGGKSGLANEDLSHRSFLILIDIPFVIPFELRVKLFYALIEHEKDKIEAMGGSMRVNMGNAIRVRINRDRVLDDGFRQLKRYYNGELKRLVQVEFVNEHGNVESGIDGGGLFKEFLNLLIKESFDPQRGLFLETPYYHEIYPNPHSRQLLNVENGLPVDYHNEFGVTQISRDEEYFRFLGGIVGKAMYDQILIEPQFASFFLRKLLGQHNYVDDLRSYDSDLYKHLMQLKHDNENSMDIDNLGLEFTVTEDILGTKYTKSLLANKGNRDSVIPVTFKNRDKYINLLCDYKLNESLNRQYKAFLKGLSNVINIDFLRIFNSDELNKLISGYNLNLNILPGAAGAAANNANGNEVDEKEAQQQASKRRVLRDLDDFQKYCQYSGGFHKKHRMISWFWEIVRDDFTSDDDTKLLMFVTSCSRPPLLGFKYLNPKFCIMCTGSSDGTSLPTSQTCMNMLKIPNYPSKEVFKEKLLYAIRTNAGFDLS